MQYRLPHRVQTIETWPTIFGIQPLYDRGRRRSERELYDVLRVECDLDLYLELDRTHGYARRVARCFEPRGAAFPKLLLPPLYEPELVTLGTHGFRLDGYEEVAGGGTRPQAWHVMYCRRAAAKER